jgi:PAS domain S-box-containing protein
MSAGDEDRQDELRSGLKSLRERAEEIVRDSHVTRGQWQSDDLLSLIHELQVHQVELEMQNDELRQTQLALETARDRYASLYERAPVGYITLDSTGKILHANEMAATLLARERTWLTQQSFVELVDREDRPRFHFFWRDLQRSTTTVTAEMRIVRPNGTRLWTRLQAILMKDETGVGQATVGRVVLSDETERRHAEEMVKGLRQELERRARARLEELDAANVQLRSEITGRELVEAELREHERELEDRVAERTHELSMLLAISRNLSSTLKLEQLLSIFLDQLLLIVDFTSCAVYLLENESLRLLDYRGPVVLDERLVYQMRLDESVGLAEVVKERQPVTIPDLAGDSELARAFRDHASSLQRELIGASRSWMGVPLIVKDEVIGVLRLDHLEPAHFTPHHAQMTLAVASHAALAVENARLYRQAKDVAAMEERQRLGRELHDSVSQTFYAIALAAHSVMVLLESNRPVALEHLDYVLSLANTGLIEMRALIFDLRPEGLQHEGLISALQKQTAALRSRGDMHVDEDLGEEPDASFEAKEVAYRIAQEALRNIMRHASARQVLVRMSHDAEAIHLQVVDDGVGFDPSAVRPGSLGLRSMRERAESVGGQWALESAPGQGTRLRAHIPLNATDGSGLELLRTDPQT